MNILVVAATKEEIVHSIPFLEENDVPYLISGVGMVSTTYTLTKALQTNKPDLLIQVGIGGILDTDAALGGVYQIETDEIFELGAEDRKNFISIEQLGFGKHRFTGRAPLLSKRLPEVPKAHGITVNKVHGSEESTSRLLSRYNQPVVESMEGSALFFVSEQEQIPALQYRAISNYIEPRNRETWQIGLAVKNINVFLRELLVHLL